MRNRSVHNDFNPCPIASRGVVVETTTRVPTIFASANALRFAAPDGFGVSEHY